MEAVEVIKWLHCEAMNFKMPDFHYVVLKLAIFLNHSQGNHLYNSLLKWQDLKSSCFNKILFSHREIRNSSTPKILKNKYSTPHFSPVGSRVCGWIFHGFNVLGWIVSRVSMVKQSGVEEFMVWMYCNQMDLRWNGFLNLYKVILLT